MAVGAKQGISANIWQRQAEFKWYQSAIAMYKVIGIFQEHLT